MSAIGLLPFLILVWGSIAGVFVVFGYLVVMLLRERTLGERYRSDP